MPANLDLGLSTCVHDPRFEATNRGTPAKTAGCAQAFLPPTRPTLFVVTLIWVVPIFRFILFCILQFYPSFQLDSSVFGLGGFVRGTGGRHTRRSRLCLAQNYDPQRHGMTQGLHSVSELRAPGVRPRACLNTVPVHAPPCVDTQRSCVSTVSYACPKHYVFYILCCITIPRSIFITLITILLIRGTLVGL